MLGGDENELAGLIGRVRKLALDAEHLNSALVNELLASAERELRGLLEGGRGDHTAPPATSAPNDQPLRQELRLRR